MASKKVKQGIPVQNKELNTGGTGDLQQGVVDEINFHIKQLELAHKCKMLEGSKFKSVRLTIDGGKIMVIGTDKNSLKKAKKKIKEDFERIQTSEKKVDPALAALLEKKNIIEYINETLGIPKLMVTWGIDTILGEHKLLVFALKKDDAKKFRQAIIECMPATEISDEVKEKTWFQDVLRTAASEVSATGSKNRCLTVFTTKAFFQKYIEPNIRQKKTSSQPSRHDKREKGSTSNQKAKPPNDLSAGQMPNSKTEKLSSAKSKSSIGKQSNEKNGQNSTGLSNSNGDDKTSRYSPQESSISEQMEKVEIKVDETTVKYLDKYHNETMADSTGKWKVNLEKSSGGYTLKGQNSNVESAAKDLQALIRSVDLCRGDINAGKPCAPDYMRKEWRKLEDTEHCCIEAEGFRKPLVKTGWIYDGDDQKMSLLIMDGKIDFCTIDVVLCPVNTNLEPFGTARTLIDQDQLQTLRELKRKYSVGDIIPLCNPENLYCHSITLHVLDGNFNVKGNQIKDLAEYIISVMNQHGFRSFGFNLRYSKDQKWSEYTFGIVQCLWMSSENFKCPASVYCFGENSDFEDLNQFLIKHLKFGTDSAPLDKFLIDSSYSTVDSAKSSTKILIEEGSILSYGKKVDAIINSVSATMDLSHGIISKKLVDIAGPTVQDECNEKHGEGIDFGDIAVTSSGKLGCKSIFHVALCTKWIANGSVSKEILRTILVRCLKGAEKRKLESIAFPALGTGTLGYPPCMVAKTMVETAFDFGKTQPNHLKNVTFVIYEDKKLYKLFQGVADWVRNRKSECLEWELPPKHVMYVSYDIEARVMMADRDYYTRMAYKELRVVFSDSGSNDLIMDWDAQNGCFVIKLKNAKSEDGVITHMKNIINLMQKERFHVVDLFLQPSGISLHMQEEILLDELGTYEVDINMKAKSTQKKIKNYVKLIRVFLHTEDYNKMSKECSSIGHPKGQVVKWHMTDIRSFNFTIQVAGQKGKVEKILKAVQSDVESLEPTTKFSWQIRQNEVAKAKKCVDKFKKANVNLDFDEDSHCVICDGTQKQLEAVGKELGKIIDSSLYFEMSEDDFVVLLYLTNDDNWRVDVSKPRYEKSRAVFLLNKSADVHAIRMCIESKLNKISQLSSMEIFPPKSFDDQFESVKAKVENIDDSIFCIIGLDKKKILIKSENYPLLQQAKYVAEVELGMIQASGRRNRVIATDEYSRYPAKNQGSNPESSIKQGKRFKTKEGIHILVYSAGILNLKVDTLVNAANKDLQHGGGIAYHISNGAGYELDKECDDYINSHGSLRVGTCISTTAGNLPYHCIIHAVGPMWHSYPNSKKQQCLDDLKQSVVSAITEAASHGLNSIAIPSISSGIFGVPKELCADQYYWAVVEYSRRNPQTSITEIHFIDKDKAMCTLIQKTFEKEFGYSGKPK